MKKGIKKGKGSRAQVNFLLDASCRAAAEKLFKELETCAMMDGLTKYASTLKLGAIKEMLDRGFGKPKESVSTGITIVWDIKSGPSKPILVDGGESPALPEPGKGNVG